MIRTLLRVLIGGLFVGHGSQKLFGWFGGYGPDGTGQFFESIGLRPGRRNAMVAGASEAGGGAGAAPPRPPPPPPPPPPPRGGGGVLAAGLFTPLAGTLLTAVMAQAIRSLKMDKGPFAQDGGWELEALFAAAALTFVEIGPGRVSLDSALGIERSGTGWALLALAAGVAGPMLVVSGGDAPEAQAPETAGAGAGGGAADAA